METGSPLLNEIVDIPLTIVLVMPPFRIDRELEFNLMRRS